MSCTQFYGRSGTLLHTPTSRMSGGASSLSEISNGIRSISPVSRRSLEQKVDSLLKSAQEQKEENMALKSQIKALEEKLENGIQNQAVTAYKKNKRIPPSLSVRLSVLC